MEAYVFLDEQFRCSSKQWHCDKEGKSSVAAMPRIAHGKKLYLSEFKVFASLCASRK